MRINGEIHYFWRAVDNEDEVLEVFATKSRDRRAAFKFLKRAMKGYGRPWSIVTDRLRSYRAALKVIGNIAGTRQVLPLLETGKHDGLLKAEAVPCRVVRKSTKEVLINHFLNGSVASVCQHPCERGFTGARGARYPQDHETPLRVSWSTFSRSGATSLPPGESRSGWAVLAQFQTG